MYVCMYVWMDLCIYLKTSRYIYISFQYLNDDIKIYLYHKYKTYIYIYQKKGIDRKKLHIQRNYQLQLENMELWVILEVPM